MAPPRLYELPHEQLVRLLAESRREGLSFEVAWKRAVAPRRALVMANTKDAPAGAVRWPTDSSERIGWQAAILAMKDQMRRAYEQRPATRRERSVTVLLGVLEGRPVGGIVAAEAVRSAA